MRTFFLLPKGLSASAKRKFWAHVPSVPAAEPSLGSACFSWRRAAPSHRPPCAGLPATSRAQSHLHGPDGAWAWDGPAFPSVAPSPQALQHHGEGWNGEHDLCMRARGRRATLEYSSSYNSKHRVLRFCIFFIYHFEGHVRLTRMLDIHTALMRRETYFCPRFV